MNKENIRDKIIDTTINCIGKYGVQSVTNRIIAKEADVNSAAVNYYFGSKENLIDIAVKRSLDNYFSSYIESPMDSKQENNVKDILMRFMSDTLSDSIDQPNYIKSYLYDTFVNGNYNSIFIKQFNIFLNQICEVSNHDCNEDLKMSIIQTVSSLMFICLMPDFFKDFTNQDLKKPDVQKKYIDSILKKC